MKTTNKILAPASLLAVLCAQQAAAESATYFGLNVVSNYMSAGTTQSADKPALQGYVEHNRASGFYAGVWFSTIDFSAYGLTDNFEIDPYIGYRGEIGKLGYDLSYTRYYYDDVGYLTDELWLAMSYGATDQVSLGLDLGHSFSGGTKGVNYAIPRISYAFNDMISADAKALFNSANSDVDWSAGLKYQVNDSLSANIRYHDSNFASSQVVFGVSWDGGIFSK